MASATLRWFEGPLRALLISPNGPVGRDLARRGVRVESAAKGACPVDTGRLRSSLRTVPGQSDGFVISVVIAANTGASVTVGSDVEYAGFVHDGTKYLDARPFLADAMPAGGPYVKSRRLKWEG